MEYNDLSRSNPIQPDSISLHAIVTAFIRVKYLEIAHEFVIDICKSTLEHTSSSSSINNTTNNKRPAPRLLIETFGSLANAWTMSDSIDAAQNADMILSNVEKMHDLGIMVKKPDRKLYSDVLQLFALADHGTHDEKIARAKRSLTILQKLCSHDADHNYANNSPWANELSYNQTINAFAIANMPDEAEHVLRGFKKDYNLRRQQQRQQQQQQIELNNLTKEKRVFRSPGPSSDTYNAVLEAWARKGGKVGVQKIKRLIDEMKHISQIGCTSVTYNTLLSCYASYSETNSRSVDDIVKIIKKMTQETIKSQQSNDTSKNTKTLLHVTSDMYNMAIQALLQRNQPIKAAQVLVDNTKLYNTTKDEQLKPSLCTFNLILDSLPVKIQSTRTSTTATISSDLCQQIENIKKKIYN
jgi:PPR repeat